MENKDRFVNELLDSALAYRRGAEPRPGLEARIIQGVRATADERIAGSEAWKLWLSVAATAAVVTVLAIRVARRPAGPVVQTPQTANAIPSTLPRETLTANSETASKVAASGSIVEPKRIAYREGQASHWAEAHHWPSQFPTPAPLTDEQKALVQYVRDTPPQMLAEPILKTETMVQRVEIKPLEIPQLEIEPLALGPVGKEFR